MESEDHKLARLGSVSKAVFAVALLAAIAIGAIRITAAETPKKIRVIYTSDMMGNWKPCG